MHLTAASGAVLVSCFTSLQEDITMTNVVTTKPNSEFLDCGDLDYCTRLCELLNERGCETVVVATTALHRDGSPMYDLYAAHEITQSQYREATSFLSGYRQAKIDALTKR